MRSEAPRIRQPGFKPTGTPGIASENIDEIVRLEEDAALARTLTDRILDTIAGFIGTLAFVMLHLLWIAAWIAGNTGLIHGIIPFDPYPFQLLSLIVALEAVLITIFVLIKQNRMAERAEERSHLSLQVALLSEQEVTKVISMLEIISHQLGIHHHVMDDEARDLQQHTAVDDLARKLRERLQTDT